MFSYIRYIQSQDTAKPTFFEVLFAYNGFHAVMWHRLNHRLWTLGLRALARFLAGFARILTGIEIHPQAEIGQNVFIDHGTGIVIGQTAIVGNNVMLYHDVTLGGVTEDPDFKGKRHPTIEDNTVIGAGAQVLGNITIHKGAKVGANAVVLKDVPGDCTAVGNPARLVHCDSKMTPYGIAPGDPIAEAIDGLMKDVERLKEKAGLKDDTPKQPQYAEDWKGSGI